MADARRRRFDVLICWRPNRLGRNLRHLLTLLDELHACRASFVSLGEGIRQPGACSSTCSPPWRNLNALASLNVSRWGWRAPDGKASGWDAVTRLSKADIQRIAGLSVREAARQIGGSATVLHRGCLRRSLLIGRLHLRDRGRNHGFPPGTLER